MFSHISVGTNDLDKAMAFYDAVFSEIGVSRAKQGDGWAAYGDYGELGIGVFWLFKPFNGDPATAGNGTNIAFMAPTRKSVDAFYAAALENGGECAGKPGIREEDHPNFYAAFIRDVDNNKIVVVCHDPE
ncbi:VOC family protein [Pseudoalteromonas ardens]|uniref:VOC domain-containing protein n=1 Tax=Pseudoalteromonas rubra TaxID=43658 RepID=A0A0L0ENU8_9GAMM|nr:VOC family protein [Pseudoalteromonas sp. R96]KNC65568.1 hypothetical protein AC626_22370 [Pseudoalteromonas rubra]MDK1313534.1 VOC family protein [Pseudoalteromonas sp. R96]